MELEKAYEEYIKFLEEYIGSNAAYLYVHGMEATNEEVEEGKRLRENIKNKKTN